MIKIDIRPIVEFQNGIAKLEQKTPNAIKNAVNATARQARNRMVKQAQKAYSVKSARFNKATKIKNANINNMTAVITAKGSPLQLMDFAVNPKKPPYQLHPKTEKKKQEQEDLVTRLRKPLRYYHHKGGGKRTSATTRARVYNSGSLKELKKGDIKAFVSYFAYNKKDKKGNLTGKTGYHIFIGQRMTKKRLPIKVLYSNSIPKMIGNEEKVFEIVTPGINEDFEREISKQMQKLFDKLSK